MSTGVSWYTHDRTFIHSGYFYSASSSPLYYSCRSAPDPSRIGYCVGVSRLSATYTVPNCFNSQTPQTLHSKALLQFFSSWIEPQTISNIHYSRDDTLADWKKVLRCGFQIPMSFNSVISFIVRRTFKFPYLVTRCYWPFQRTKSPPYLTKGARTLLICNEKRTILKTRLVLETNLYLAQIWTPTYQLTVEWAKPPNDYRSLWLPQPLRVPSAPSGPPLCG